MTVLGVDLGGTHMRCAAVGSEVTHRSEALTPHDGTGVAALVTLMKSVVNAAGCDTAVIGVPGRVDYRAGTLDKAPNLPQPWIPFLTTDALSKAVDLPVALANDADLAAVGEAYSGAGSAYRDVAYVTLSTGIGAGIVLGKRLVHGGRSLAEVGHEVLDLTAFRAGQPSTWEELASGTALGKRAAAAGLGNTGHDVIAAVSSGSEAAAGIWDDVVQAICVGVGNVVWAFAPEVIVIGGGLGLVGDLLLDPIRKAIGNECAVVAAALGDDAGLMGAGSWAQAFVAESP